MSRLKLEDVINFDELPTDRRMGLLFVPISVGKNIEQFWSKDAQADILWHRYYSALGATAILIHHPVLPPVEDLPQMDLPVYDCEMVFYKNGTIEYIYRRIA